MKKAIVTGITGQDGSYLAELLLSKGYAVYGMKRRTSTDTQDRVSHIVDTPNFHIVHGDLTDQGSLDRLIESVQPDEFYNLAAQSFVKESWNQPTLTMDVTGIGPLRCLEAIRKFKPDTKFLQASSSEMFGKVTEPIQNEETRFYPRSPYGVAKVAAHYATINYRESYDIFACSSICYNHESRRRGLEFVTRKITDGVAQIVAGVTNVISLGNLDPKRDWGHASDYVRAMYMMLQADEADDYVISTGETHSIGEFLSIAFQRVGKDWRNHVVQDPQFMRPAEVDLLLGDSSKIREKLGWSPSYSFEELVYEMVDADLESYNVKRPVQINKVS